MFPILNTLAPPSPSHPSGSSQCTGPVSCIEPGLLIYFTYDNRHVSMLFSQIIPPSPSPTEPKSLFFISVSLLLVLCYLLSSFFSVTFFFFSDSLHMNASDWFYAFIISLYHPKQISFCYFLFILLKAFRSWVLPFFRLCLECLSYFMVTVSLTAVLNFTPSFIYEIALKPKRDSAENHSGL